MKFLATVLLALLSSASFAGISVYDSLNTAHGPRFKSRSCEAGIMKLDRQIFRLKELEAGIVPLARLNKSKIFYHYTDAKVLLQLLVAEEEDRSKAQTTIVNNGSLEEIFTFSYKSTGDNAAGRGLYLAGNPLSSIDYGKIQTSFKIKEDTKIVKMSSFELLEILSNLLMKHNLISPCNNRPDVSLLMTLILQESGVDLIFYDEYSDWFMLVNESVIEETNIIAGIRSDYDLINKMLDANRIDEMEGLSLALKCPIFNNCHKDILEKIIRHNHLNFLPDLIHANINLELWENAYTDISSAFNRNLKAKNTAVVDALLSVSCAPNDYGDKRISGLADYLVDHAPDSLNMYAKTRKQAVCGQ